MGLELDLSQKQIISQQMIQSMKILQMNYLELQEFISEMAMENPVIDMEENYGEERDRQEEIQRKLDWLESTDLQNKVYYQQDHSAEDMEGNWQDKSRTEETLAEYLLDRLDRQDSGAVTLGYEFYRIAGEENPSLRELLENWNREKEEGEPETGRKAEKTIIRYDENGRTVVEEDCIREREPERNFDAVSPEWTGTPGGGTSFLGTIREPGLFLRSESAAYPDLRITKNSFLIGKKRDAVDGWLKARGISRIHSRISREEDCYYLTDLNSTNGTYLNGGRLEVNEKARLRPGDCVAFADVRYVVEG